MLGVILGLVGEDWLEVDWGTKGPLKSTDSKASKVVGGWLGPKAFGM